MLLLAACTKAQMHGSEGCAVKEAEPLHDRAHVDNHPPVYISGALLFIEDQEPNKEPKELSWSCGWM